MSIEVVQAICVAITMAVLIAAWAHLHFHAPYRIDDIRYSVSPVRYFVALFIHMAGMVGIYCVLFLAIYPFASLLMYGVGDEKCWTCWDCTEDCGLEELPIVWAALVSGVSVRLIFPIFPGTCRILTVMRSIALRVAQYPTARERVVASIAANGFHAGSIADAYVLDELAGYGIAGDVVPFLSKSAFHALVEVCFIRNELQSLHDRIRARRTFASRIGMLVSICSGPERHDGVDQRLLDLWLAEFWDGRRTIWLRFETEYRRLIRRSARALLLVENSIDQAAKETVGVAISNFVLEEADEVLVHYRRFIAELVIFCIPSRLRQEELLKSFGYTVRLPVSLPLRPWIIVFVLDFVLFLLPALISQLEPRMTSSMPLAPLALFAVVHAISQTVALTWAIVPKMFSNFARPSLYTLPWPSYAVYGVGAYLSGAALLLLFRFNVPLPFPIVLPTLVSSVSFLLITVGISVLIDRRLRLKTEGLAPQAYDGLIIGLLMLLGTVSFQLIMFHIAPRLGWVQLEFSPPATVRATFVVLSGTLGFVIGYFVPSAAAKYLHEASKFRPSYSGDPSDLNVMRSPEQLMDRSAIDRA